MRLSISEEDTSSPESTSETTSENDGGHSTVDELHIPNDELMSKVIQQLELYFSDANLTKDAFLQKHVRRNKEGYVSLKLVSSFKKIRSLTKDWRVVLYSAKNSENLAVNAEETKLRRVVPFLCENVKQKTELKPKDQACTVIATNLTNECQTIEAVSEIFSQCGTVTSVRILKPGSEVSVDLKHHFRNNKGNRPTTCSAVVEFVKPEFALAAVSKLGGKENDWRSMHVTLVQKKTNKTEKDSKLSIQVLTNGDKLPKKNKAALQKVSLPVYMSEQGGDGEPNTLSSFRRKTYTSLVADLRRRGSSFTTTFNDDSNSSDSSRSSPHGSPAQTRRHKSSSVSEPMMTVQPSPWVQRRLEAAKNAGLSNSCSTAGRKMEGGYIPEGVIRLPKGPDGTRGFHANTFQSRQVITVG